MPPASATLVAMYCGSLFSYSVRNQAPETESFVASGRMRGVEKVNSTPFLSVRLPLVVRAAVASTVCSVAASPSTEGGTRKR